MSSARNRHLFCPTPAKEMIASRCSCGSLVQPGEVMGASLTCGSDAITCFAAPLIPHAPRCFVPTASPSSTRCFGTFRTGGLSSGARAPRNQGSRSVLSTICLSLRSSTHGSIHGFADGSSGRPGPWRCRLSDLKIRSNGARSSFGCFLVHFTKLSQESLPRD